MVQKPLQILALLAALESPIALQQAQHDPWLFLEQFGITPQTLVAHDAQHQLPAFNDDVGAGNQLDSTWTITDE